MSVILLDDKRITKYISLGILDILGNSELAKQFCLIIQNRQLYGHSLDTARYAVQIALVLDKNIDLVELAKAGLLHDIGKIDIPIEILNKPGKLNDYERSIMDTHAEKGYERLANTGVEIDLQDVARHHHEKLTGGGYPDGIKDIKLLTQIITIADIFSALTELRSYKKPITSAKAFEIMRDMEGLNKDFIRILGSRVFDEIDDFRARKWAAYYRGRIRAFRVIYTPEEMVWL